MIGRINKRGESGSMDYIYSVANWLAEQQELALNLIMINGPIHCHRNSIRMPTKAG